MKKSGFKYYVEDHYLFHSAVMLSGNNLTLMFTKSTIKLTYIVGIFCCRMALLDI